MNGFRAMATAETPSRGLGPIPPSVWATLIAGSVAAIAFALQTRTVFWLVVVSFFLVLNVSIVAIGRQRLLHSNGPGRTTGRVLTPAPMPAPFAVGLGTIPTMRWTGGAYLPGPIGRIRCSAPLGVLDISGDVLTISLRGMIFASMFGVRPFVATRAQIVSIFPVGRRFYGVGVFAAGRPVGYFWTTRRAEVLTALHAAGFPASLEERRFKY